MPCKILLAGAAGVIGRQLSPLLAQAGYEVFGTTRKPERCDFLAACGVQPVLADMLDKNAVESLMARVKPHIIINQLTDLPANLEPSAMAEGRIRNAHIRREGTRNLMEAAQNHGVGRVITQSICWLYAGANTPHSETAPLYEANPSTASVLEMESLTLNAVPITGLVLRYGAFYGPETPNPQAAGACPVHVQAAAYAALLAVQRGEHGIYNIADDTGYASIRKAQTLLGWNPHFRC